METEHDVLPPGLGRMINPGALFSAQTGSVVVTALVDLEAEYLHVINLGDCRAVAGWYHYHDKAWECDVLSEDHTPENLSEAQRYGRSHY